MNISRRHFFTAVVAGFGASACNLVPDMGDGPPRVGVKSAMRMGPAPIKGPEAKFAFVEITGAPASHIIEFNKAIDREAKSRNLTVVPQGNPSATYLVKGYLSAIGDKRGTLLIYVWDVSDVNGRRLHRVSGQEPASGSGTDPWGGITPKAVSTAAERTIDDLIAWVS